MSAGEEVWIDAVGRPHSPVTSTPRLACLVPSITELLFDLGLGERVVACTDYCVHPEAGLAAVPRVGGTKRVRLDRLRELAPTHVIVNVDENRRADAEQIAAFAEVIATHPIDPVDNLDLFAGVGRLFHAESAALVLRRRLQVGLDSVRLAASRIASRDVLYLIWRKPWMTVGPDTYISRMLALIGWRTVRLDVDGRYPCVDPRDPRLGSIDCVLLSSEPFPFTVAHGDEFRQEVGRPDLPVCLVDGEMLSWYGSRAIQGLDYLTSLPDRALPNRRAR